MLFQLIRFVRYLSNTILIIEITHVIYTQFGYIYLLNLLSNLFTYFLNYRHLITKIPLNISVSKVSSILYMKLVITHTDIWLNNFLTDLLN